MSTTQLITKIRTLLSDNIATWVDTFTYENSAIFTLSEPNVVSVSDVSVNDTSSGVSYTYSSSSNKVTLGSSASVGDTIHITYTYYPNYSDTELKNYFQAALVHLSVNSYGDISYDSSSDEFYPDLEGGEENLIAIIAATLIDPGNRTIRLPDITISVPNDLPTNQKITRYIASFKHGSGGSNTGIFAIV